ncbi:protein MAK11 [Fistulifera solaris]|uniref:Protein MAK11 n=1 Tax=Fistulifera solaris TaxID=1519565 RepID=A0A1Z5J9M4_FISSO|nr:protein MAK11 [Fistulifera solaris]|eukprot:GAX10508.1 protein MAK11 [Fistulifera solaris]
MTDSFRVIVAAGTYDGVLAGWELTTRKNKFEIVFASPSHIGSIRSVAHQDTQHTVVSCGYDEVIKTHNFAKRQTDTGEVRTPSAYGTPCCSSFAQNHCLVGFSEGHIVIYKKRDWSVQHVLKGHEGGVSSIAVHPTGKMALTGGSRDGKLKLWDLTRGRLAFSTKIASKESIDTVVWASDGSSYGFGYGSHVTVRDVASGSDLLDIELPSRVNQVCFIEGDDGMFLVAACNDGSLPVLDVPKSVDPNEQERFAVMAIEAVEGPVAGEERFKCIQAVQDYHVVTATSAGVISLMNLQGSVNMIKQDKLANKNASVNHREEDSEEESDDGRVSSDSDDEELAVEIVDSTQLGTGARITCLVAYSYSENGDDGVAGDVKETKKRKHEDGLNQPKTDKHLKRSEIIGVGDLEKARKLVSKAKKIQKRNEEKKRKPKKT